MELHSQAFSHSRYFQGQVDPRTGQYVSRILLATLYPKGALELSREVVLSFSMMSPNHTFYGAGWRIGITQFELDTSKFTLSTGERFSTHGLPSVGNTLQFKDRKLKDLVVTRPDASTLHVVYKDGVREVLTRTSSVAPYRTSLIEFESGERLHFRYDDNDALEQVLDDDQVVLLKLVYSGRRIQSVDTRIDGGRYARMLFTVTGSRLMNITAPYEVGGAPESAGYAFQYAEFSNGLIAITRVQSPTGGDELITYTERGHPYAQNQFIPRVNRWVVTPAAFQPPMTRTYGYSTPEGFTGYPFIGGYNKDEDNAYTIGGDYIYTVEEKCLGPNDSILVTTRNTYNKYHLLTEQYVLREGTETTKLIEYNVVPGLFPAQPVNFQLPKLITTRYALLAGGKVRETKVEITIDDYGNEISRTEESGVCTESIYYPVAGEAGKCPADPHNLFQHYIKQERLIPVGGTPAARLTEYTHTRVPATGTLYVVVQQSITQAAAFSQQQTYFDTPVALAGRLKTSTCTIDGQSLCSKFSYTVTGDTLTETRELVGREGQSLESVRTLSLVTRNLLSVTGDGNCSLAMVFDASGRMVSEITSAGTPQQAGRTYAYHFKAGQKNAHLVTTDAQGNRAITYFDGIGRRVSEAELLAGDVEVHAGSWAYDAQGRQVESVKTDHLPDGTRTLKSLYTYNPWGDSSSTINPDGSVSIDDYDPQLNRRLTGTVGGERQETVFNEFGQPAKVNRLDTQDNSVEMESSTYDGLGRCTTREDKGNKRTDHFFYDAFDRVVRVREVPADGSPVREQVMAYASGTSEDHVTAITINGIEVATRSYDSLGRLTSQARGKAAATTFGYETNWTEPVTRTSPQGAVQTLLYDKQLDVVEQVKLAGHPDQDFLFNPTDASLKRSTSAGLVHELLYDKSGFPKSEVHTANGSVLTVGYSHSPAGRMLHHTAADGQRSQYDYDLQGRFIKMTAGSLIVEQRYNAFGQPDTLITTHGTTRVDTKITFDLLGREGERRFEQNGVLLKTLTSTYHPSGLLATRSMRGANGTVVTGESYEYDAFGRLKDYKCQGSEHPLDRQGRGITGQQFTFDSLDNLTRVVTTFVGGSQDVCQRFFTGPDPTQLMRLTHTNPVQDKTLTYDPAGNLLSGQQGQVYTFDGYDQLIHVQNNTQSIRYQYNAEGRQVVATRGAEPAVSLAYVGDRLDTLAEGSKKVRYFEAAEHLVLRSGGVDGPQLHVNDAAGSVRGLVAPGQPHVSRNCTAYGDTTIPLNDGKVRTLADLQVPGFNGERFDLSVSLYHLGNGQRAYDPDLKMFLSPDPLSPFHAGINAYGYCNGDPINQSDPSGLFPNWLKWVFTGAALALGVVALGIGVAGIAAIGLAAATAAQIVGTVGTAMGVIGSTLGVAALGIEAVDGANGWDRSHHIRNLGWAAFGFSMASWSASTYNAWGAASKAYQAGKRAVDVGRRSAFSAGTDLPAREGMRSLIKSFSGRTFKINNRISPGSKAFGSIRAFIRTTNLMRSFNARYVALASESQEVADEGGGQQQPQMTMRQFVDMSHSASRFYQSFWAETRRIRKPIVAEAYQQTS
ncbi:MULTISPECIES: RHS repeat domain-containing protein [Pseudomonas]|uniref:Type IV secretion protein Rhs n=2 Tax=Pseudomonas TaxID=286 RepID=A0A0A1YWT8_PSEFL|nr:MULTISPECIES: RHS repeat-associated core domain-containing protein [Pseudomonas]KGE65316.1 type IV secretion protein Rhs [Pseudomonas fluorescens LMG 5329]NWE00180.1 RHS repeat-associated core domain-containing protein [Pseudomonas sp. IPO3749]NWF18760.1 RHS repeat-associated core domain-containing protein [Pseudomonas sp. IPO3749]